MFQQSIIDEKARTMHRNWCNVNRPSNVMCEIVGIIKLFHVLGKFACSLRVGSCMWDGLMKDQLLLCARV